MRSMAVPLFTLQGDLDTRTLSLLDKAAQSNNQSLNVRED
jgi:hypothetical protein